MGDRSEAVRVLFVDDEPNLLDGMRRQLRREFDVHTAVGAAKGLFALGEEGPFEVIVSDFLMPGINGAQFLATARKISPDSTRMLLTGHTDLADAAATVNEGQIFRMLLKPVDPATMTAALHDCAAQHRLVTAERELLDRTLKGSVKALTDVLALASPVAFGRGARMRRTAAAVLDVVGCDDRWAVELAVEMAQLGVVSLPAGVIGALETGEPLGPAEAAMTARLPAVATEIISAIPRLAPVAEAIAHSRRGFDGSGDPHDDRSGDRLPLGARLLRLVQDYDALTVRGLTPAEAVTRLRGVAGAYDPVLLEALANAHAIHAPEIRSVSLGQLCSGMVLAGPVTSGAGVLLVTAGQEVTPSLMARLRNFALLEEGLAEPLRVFIESAPPATER